MDTALNVPSDIGERLRKAREVAGITLGGAFESAPKVWSIEAGQAQPTGADLIALARLYKITVHSLVCNHVDCVVCDPQGYLRAIVDEIREEQEKTDNFALADWAERLGYVADQIRKMQLRAEGKLG